MRADARSRIQQTISRARFAHEASMLDECTIRRPDTDGPFNETTGTYDPVPGDLVYEGCCKYKVHDSTVTLDERADTALITQTFVLAVPHDAGDIKVGDVVKITRWTDGGPVDHPLRVAKVPSGTWRVKRELPLEEVTFDG